MDPLKAKANFTRICQLLVDQGGNALRAALHAKHPPSTLAAALNANKMTLQKIRHTVIKLQQWTLLFPASGTPDSNNFDISLLTIILQNICGLRSPAAGWDIMPPASDTSISADILRIKMYRNRVYGHIPTAQYDDTTFEKLWQEISKSLIKLGIPQEDIDELKLDPLSPEAESYIEKLKEWKELEDDMLLKLNDLERGVLKVENKVLKLQRIVENPVPSQVDQLAKFDFTGEIDDLCKKCQNGTRQWFFDMLLNWSNHENSRVMILSTDPDVGENVLFAKVCKLYKQRGQLAACHTYDFGNSDHSSPYRILQSLASQMCENVDGFRDTLTEVLRREHSRDSLSDAFRVLLSDPLHDLCRRDPLLIVLDASNKKKPDVECEFLEMIFDEFLELPKCVKVLAWSKAGLNARKKLLHLQSEHLAQCCLLNAGLCSLNSKLIPVHSDKFGSTIALDKPRSSITVFGFIGRLVNKVEEHYIFNAIPISNVGPNAPTSMQQATYKEALKVADQVSSSELLHCISEAKVIFEETLHSLDLFENYLKSPSEETAKPLKLLFDCGQSAYDEIFTTGTIGNFLEFVRTFLINKCSQDAEDEGKRSQHFDQKSSNSVNRNLDSDIGLDSQPNSILEEASQLDLKNEKSSPLLPNFENNEKKLESEKCSKVVNVASQTPVNAPGKFEDSFVQLSLNPKAKLERDSGNNSTTQIKDCVSSKEDYSIGEIRNKDKSKKKPEREISKDSSMIDHVLPQLKQGKQGKGIDGYVKYSGAEKKKKSEKMLKSLENEENALKSRSFIQFPEPPAVMLSLRVKELEEENLFLESQMKSLQAKYEESLAELGQIAVQKTAKENEERKSELFQQIFRSPLSEATALPTSKDRPINDMNVNGSLNRFLKPQTTQERADAPSVIYPAAFSEQPVEGAEALVQRGNHQPGKEEMVTSDKDESEIQRGDRRSTEVATFRNNNENQTPSTQNSLSNTSREKTNGGEEINKSGKIHETSDLASTSRKGYENLSFSVQQDDSGTDYISLGNVPPTSVATTLYNNYKLLLLSLAQRLLSCDVVQLRNWATQNFSISDPQNATDILFQLDRKGVINASDLSQLYHFFESIVRIDLVYIIDAFLLGDYSLLRQTSAPKKQGANAAQTPQYRTTTMYQSMFNAINTSRQSLVNSATSSTLRTSAVRNPATLGKPENNNGAQIYLPKPTQQAAFRNSSDATNPTHVSRSPNENLSTASEQQNLKPAATGFTPTRMADVVVADGSSVANERRTMAGNSLTRTNPSVTNNARNTQAVGSNGSKHSKFQRSEIERSNMSNFQPPGGSRNQYLDREGNWLCSHYKRHCYVKFECCNNFWPCHRCHNNQSTCGRKKLKSRDTEMLKCAYCNKVQQFGHSCCDCGAKFAEYYCGLCKHLTAKDDNPYHCEKCGICRIHGDRSFHCDICGVCLDVQLRGNHKCREDSAHDECCICLEDAFTGCQILPCSHKVHKECATQMIRSGITRCPICRESFAHKLERRPPPISRNRPGK